MEFDLPDLPDTDYNLIPPNTIFYPPLAEVPYLDPLLLPSLEQVQGGLQDQGVSSSEGDKEKSTEEVSPITPPPVLNNLPTTKEILPSDETVATFTIPLIGEFPIPAPEVIVTSVITSGVSATAAVTGSIVLQSVINQLKKVMTKIFKKVLKKEITDRQKDRG
tara:strand:- start:12 stop:500 length:489 start_codon:yes stop_codon:yes gene_type:complete